jgi:hypothetical protein
MFFQKHATPNMTFLEELSRPQTPIRIGVVQFPGESDVKPCYQEYKTCREPGFEIEIIVAAMRILRWNFTFVEANTFGYQYDETDPTKWNGLVGKSL